MSNVDFLESMINKVEATQVKSNEFVRNDSELKELDDSMQIHNTYFDKLEEFMSSLREQHSMEKKIQKKKYHLMRCQIVREIRESTTSVPKKYNDKILRLRDELTPEQQNLLDKLTSNEQMEEKMLNDMLENIDMQENYSFLQQLCTLWESQSNKKFGKLFAHALIGVSRVEDLDKKEIEDDKKLDEEQKKYEINVKEQYNCDDLRILLKHSNLLRPDALQTLEEKTEKLLQDLCELRDEKHQSLLQITNEQKLCEEYEQNYEEQYKLNDKQNTLYESHLNKKKLKLKKLFSVWDDKQKQIQGQEQEQIQEQEQRERMLREQEQKDKVLRGYRNQIQREQEQRDRVMREQERELRQQKQEHRNQQQCKRSRIFVTYCGLSILIIAFIYYIYY